MTKRFDFTAVRHSGSAVKWDQDRGRYLHIAGDNHPLHPTGGYTFDLTVSRGNDILLPAYPDGLRKSTEVLAAIADALARCARTMRASIDHADQLGAHALESLDTRHIRHHPIN